MAAVSIDVEACRSVSSGLRSLVTSVRDERGSVRVAAEHALCSTVPLKAMDDPLDVLGEAAVELDARVDLAIALNTGDSGRVPGGGVLTYEAGSDDSYRAVRQRLGEVLASGVLDLRSAGNHGRDGVERFAFYTDLLERYGDDQVVVDAFVGALGPDGVVEVPVVLHDLMSTYETYRYGSEEDLFWDDDTTMREHLAALQQQFMESFGAAVGSATRSADFRRANPDFTAALVERVTQAKDAAGWGLSQVLRFGTYDHDFLLQVGRGLYEAERDAVGPFWGGRFGAELDGWTLGTGDGGGHYDPFVGLFEAMSRTPEAAADFFNPMGDPARATEYAEYFIRDRRWNHDDFNALGMVLDAGGTVYHQAGASQARQTQSAWIASAAVHYLAQRGDGDQWWNPFDHPQRIGDAGKDSLGHLLAAYITDIDRVAMGANGSLGTEAHEAMEGWEVGLPVGAGLDKGELSTVMREVMTDRSASGALGAATAAWNEERITYAMRHWSGADADSAQVHSSTYNSAALLGFVLEAQGAGLTADAKNADETTKAYLGFASDVIGLIPTGGTFSSFLVDQATGIGQDAITDGLTGRQARVAAETHSVQEVAVTDLQIAIAVAAAEAGHIAPEGMVDQSGRRYPWFDGGGFDPDALSEPDVRNAFIQWAHSSEVGHTMTQVVPDVDAGFNRGSNRERDR